MKKLLITLFLAVSTVVFSFAQNELPEKARIFLETHFSNIQIQKVSRVDIEQVQIFKVLLADKTQIEFDQTGAWTKINYKKSPKTISYLPETLQQEIESNKQIKKVREIETDGYDIAIQLKNKKQVKGNKFGKLEK